MCLANNSQSLVPDQQYCITWKLEMQILGPWFRPIESETEYGACQSVLTSPLADFDAP